MKKKTIQWTISVAALCAVLLFALAGCGSEASDEDFSGEEYDVSYLEDVYAQQLITDGAKTVTGTLEIEGSEGDYTVTVNEKKVVSNTDYEKGYYIADRNRQSVCPLSSDLGVAALSGDEPVLMQTEEFIDFNSKHPDSLYTVYLMGDTAELILPLDPASAE